MADKGYTKLKLLYIKDYLERNSDEDTPVSADELMEMLNEKGIECERKSIYSDIKALKQYGVDIISVRNPKAGYCICSRDFELPEVRLLVDAVQSANFITAKKSKELIEKIGGLCSHSQYEYINKQVFIDNPMKCTNEEIYYNIDKISQAIQRSKQISFTYRKRILDEQTDEIETAEKQLVVSPYAMIWSNDHYYLVGNNSKYDNLMHTRIDRMKKVEICEERARSFSEVSPYKAFFDSADYSGKIFNMFSGDNQKLKIICDNSIIEEILDRFPTAKLTSTKDEEKFELGCSCVVSEGLVSWIMQFGSKIQVVKPESLRQDILTRAAEILGQYE